MAAVSRVLDAKPVRSLDDYLEVGGGVGLDSAIALGGEAVLEEIKASGLRGRGGAGFPTGLKWRTVINNRDPAVPTTVVVNAAEGEPGSFKDRAILRTNPYRVVEGALIAARTIGASRVIIAVKGSFRIERQHLEQAITDLTRAGWCEDIYLQVANGPSEYLFGEETALLEVLDGRGPFPRTAPPYRRGIEDGAGEVTSAEAKMSGPDTPGEGDPVLVNNVETMANVALILANSPDWFREMGTPSSPGTIVCTVSGDVRTAGVAEFPMGTPLATVIEEIGGGARPKRRLQAALSGVANPLLPAAAFDTPLTYEDMKAAGAGLGAAGFLVFDDRSDIIAVVEGVSRFLSVESCGQCTPCKQDGLTITSLLDRARRGQADHRAVKKLEDRLRTVTRGARCYLAEQHQLVVKSLLFLFPDAIPAACANSEARVGIGRILIAPIADIDDGVAVLDMRQQRKQPDWTYGRLYSGQSPADRIDTAREA